MKIQELLYHAKNKRVAVIGDLIIDRYIRGYITRISPEAPVPILFQERIDETLGGAGNVRQSLENLGINADLYCTHRHPASLRQFSDNIFATQGLHSVKTRYMSGAYQLLRVDEELPYNEIEWNSFKQFSWWTHLQEVFGDYDCIVFVDYHKGVLSDSLILAVMELALHYKIPILADCKFNFDRFRDASVVKCNRIEWGKQMIINNEFTWLYSNNVDHFVVTDGDHGMTLYSKGKHAVHVDGYEIDIVDVCGAGDTVTAILAMMLATGRDMINAINLANIAASEACRHQGVYPITWNELVARCEQVNQTDF